MQKFSKVVDRTVDMFDIPPLKDNFKGLAYFVNDVRNCKSEEDEKKRINKEISHIREQFSLRTLDFYQKKKSIAKLIFIHLLGYPLEFGHLEALSLIASDKFTNKSIGYMFISCIYSSYQNFECIPLVISTLKSDINSTHQIFKAMAFRASSYICVAAVVEALYDDVWKYVKEMRKSPNTSTNSVLSTLLNMIRFDNKLIPLNIEDVSVFDALLNSEKHSTISSTASLIEFIMQYHPNVYQSTAASVLKITEKLLAKNLLEKESPKEKVERYYSFHQPWLLVKLLRLLKFYTYSDPQLLAGLNYIFSQIIDLIEQPKSIQKSHHFNTKYSIVYEYFETCLHLNSLEGIMNGLEILLRPLDKENSTLKSISLYYFAKSLQLGVPIEDKIKCQSRIALMLKSDNREVRKQAFEVMCTMCNKENIDEIVAIMIEYVAFAPAQNNEAAIKIVILAETYSPSYQWYLNIIISIIESAGNYLDDNIWCRVCQLIVSNEEVQTYSCEVLFELLKTATMNQNLIKLAVYVLGECGTCIINNQSSSPSAQLEAILNWFDSVSNLTKAIIISTLGKMMNNFPTIRNKIQAFMNDESVTRNINAEVQQRAIEIIAMCTDKNIKLMSLVYAPIQSNSRGISSDMESKSLFSDMPKQSGNLMEKFGEELYEKEMINFTSMPMDYTEFSSIPKSHSESNVITISVDTKNFISKNDDTLFSTPLINIDISIGQFLKTKANLSVGFAIKNKSNSSISDFTGESDPLIGHFLDISYEKCAVIPPMSSSFIMVNFSLIEYYSYDMILQQTLKFNHNGVCHVYVVPIPIFPHHFNIPIPLSSSDFFARWQSIKNQSVKVMHSLKYIEKEYIENTFKNLRYSLMNDIDPNPNNVCVATGMYFSTHSVGILARVEINPTVMALRFTIRATVEEVGERLIETLISLIG